MLAVLSSRFTYIQMLQPRPPPLPRLLLVVVRVKRRCFCSIAVDRSTGVGRSAKLVHGIFRCRRGYRLNNGTCGLDGLCIAFALYTFRLQYTHTHCDRPSAVEMCFDIFCKSFYEHFSGRSVILDDDPSSYF